MFPNRRVKVDLNIHIDAATGNLNLPSIYNQPDFDRFESMIEGSPITAKNVIKTAYHRFAYKDSELSTVNELQLSEIMHLPQSENPSPKKGSKEIPQFKIDLDQINKVKNTYPQHRQTNLASANSSKPVGYKEKDIVIGRASLNSQHSQKSTTGGQKSKSKKGDPNGLVRTISNIMTNRDIINIEPVIEVQSVITKPLKNVADVKSFTYFVKSNTAAHLSSNSNEKGSSKDKPDGFRSSFEGQITPSSTHAKGRGLKLNLGITSIDQSSQKNLLNSQQSSAFKSQEWDFLDKQMQQQFSDRPVMNKLLNSPKQSISKQVIKPVKSSPKLKLKIVTSPSSSKQRPKPTVYSSRSFESKSIIAKYNEENVSQQSKLSKTDKLFLQQVEKDAKNKLEKSKKSCN